MTDNHALILVVEDNPDNRTLIKDVLDALNYSVIEATDGNEGVEMALSKKPALILMDLSLPHKDGWAATREIKANPALAGVPIIALTAHAMVGDRERALDAGCDDYISKPINLMELNQKIQRYLAKPEEKSQSDEPVAPPNTVASAPAQQPALDPEARPAEVPQPAKPETPKSEP